MRTVGALCGVILLWLAAASVAQAGGGAIAFSPKGTLDYVWTGDPARGCAAAGVCGVVGSLQVEMYDSGTYESTPTAIDLNDPNSVARVIYPSDDGGQPSVCVEPEPYDVGFRLGPRYGRKREAVADEQLSEDLPSAGDCAGPTVVQLLKARLPARPLGRHGYDLSGSDSFGAGPFEVNVSSSMQAPAAKVSGGSGVSSPGQPKPRRELEEYADIDYRLVDFRGGLSIPFHGAQSPGCEPIAACGASGALTFTLRARDQTYQLSGSQIVQHRIGAGRAVMALLDGRLPAYSTYGDIAMSGALTGTFVAPGFASCTGAMNSRLALFTSFFNARSDLLAFGTDSGFAGPDPLRTDCPGPSAADAVPNTSFASGAITLGEFGSKRFNVVLHARGSFASGAYTGTRRGSITFTLIRGKERGGTRTIRAVPGEYP